MTTNNAAVSAAHTGTEGLRASDADREQTVRTLRDHYESGRIEYDEFNRRIDVAYDATHAHQLGALVADLPPAQQPQQPAAPAPRQQPQRRSSAGRVIAIVGLAVFALAGLFWLTGTVTSHPVLTVIAVAVIGFILVKRRRRNVT